MRRSLIGSRDAMLRRIKLRSALLAAFILPFAAPLLANAQQKKVGPAQQAGSADAPEWPLRLARVGRVWPQSDEHINAYLFHNDC